jgi:hypothetical protein
MTNNNAGKINHLKQNIKSLEGEMKGLDDVLDLSPEDLLPSDDILDGINDIEIFDYQKEIDVIQQDCNETLECLSKLYLSTDDIQTKNLTNIIKNDSEALADLKFSLSCSKRGIINLMRNIDMGINDPLMYQSVGILQKEIRDSIKMLYDIQKKMKEFYKEIKEELDEINTVDANGEVDDAELLNDDDSLHIVDMDKLTDQLDDFRKESDKDEDDN